MSPSPISGHVIEADRLVKPGGGDAKSRDVAPPDGVLAIEGADREALGIEAQIASSRQRQK